MPGTEGKWQHLFPYQAPPLSKAIHSGKAETWYVPCPPAPAVGFMGELGEAEQALLCHNNF